MCCFWFRWFAPQKRFGTYYLCLKKYLTGYCNVITRLLLFSLLPFLLFDTIIIKWFLNILIYVCMWRAPFRNALYHVWYAISIIIITKYIIFSHLLVCLYASRSVGWSVRLSSIYHIIIIFEGNVSRVTVFVICRNLHTRRRRSRSGEGLLASKNKCFRLYRQMLLQLRSLKIFLSREKWK